MILLVTALRLFAVPLMGEQAPLLPFGFAVFAAAYLGGFGPALAATAAAAIAATLLFADFSSPPHVVAWTGHVLLFTTLGGLVALLMHRLQSSYRAQREALAAAEVREEELRTITAALQDARLRLALAMRVGRSGAFEWHVDANENIWSDELLELYGFEPGAFGGTLEAWLECVLRDDAELVRNRLEHADAEHGLEVTYRIERRDTGDTRWMRTRGKMFVGADGKSRRMIGVHVDVTEQKRAEEALREADRRKDEFLAMLAHELRNPLAPIRNVAHILSDPRADMHALRRCGPLVERQVSTLGRLVDDLLDVARIRRGLIGIKSAPIDLQAIVDDAIETLQSTFDEKQQLVLFNRIPAPTPIMGDAVRLEQMFVNVLANAAKFSAHHARIEIEAAIDGQAVAVTIRDHGEGVDAQLLPRIFDLFVQGDQTLDRPKAGLGIGLTLAKWIVELHKGDIRIHSQGLGHGAEVVVRLPLSQDVQRATSEPPGAAPFNARRRVLIVEDNGDSAESLRMLLRLAGHDAIATSQAFSALEALEFFAPEWVFADLGLPGLDGLSLAGMIRRHPKGKDVRLFAITGYGRDQDREHARRAGFDGHLTKPVDPKVILALLGEQRVDRHAAAVANDTEQ